MKEMEWLTNLGWLTVLAILITSGCVSYAKHKDMRDNKNRELTAIGQHNKSLAKALNKEEADRSQLEVRYKALQAENEALKRRVKVNEEALYKLEANILKALGQIPGVEVTARGGEIQGEVLFDSGKADLKKGGKEILAKVADVFKKYPNCLIRIEGHTDNDPIMDSAGQWTTRSNFELGAYRALKVLLFLEEQGIDPGRMYQASFGEHCPQAPNDTQKNKARNRRVVIGFEPMTVEKKSPKEPRK